MVVSLTENIENIVLLLLVCLVIQTEGGERKFIHECQEITIPMCQGIGYNLTYMPNQFNHDSQEEAGLEVHQFWPLVEIDCSPDLKFFLCSMYSPICIEAYSKPLPACRSVCERAKAGCAPLMRQYGFKWPERMTCKDLPEFGDKDLCMDFNNNTKNKFSPKHKNQEKQDTNLQKRIGLVDGKGTERVLKQNKNTLKNTPLLSTITIRDCQCKCKIPFINLENRHHSYTNTVVTGGINNCAVSCYSAYFDNGERSFASFWIGLWSIICALSTTITLSTFAIDMDRFQYPERPIIFLSACYLMVSAGYIVRLIIGHEGVACDGKVIRYSTTGPAPCTIVFLLIYLFGMASSLWWVILAFTWFLSAGLKWSSEAITGYSQYFHIIAWLIPSIKSITILALSSVDGDPISGICYVGNQNLNNLRGFVLTPLFVYLILGTSFLLGGFVSLFRIRNVIKQQGKTKTEKLEKLMIRIGVFSVLYAVPHTIVISCLLYEQYFKDTWETQHNCPCTTITSLPNYSIYMLKYFMCLVVGITSGFWVWSGKTLESWRTFYNKICHKNISPTNRTKYVNEAYLSAKKIPLAHV
uniref:Frizzled5/8 protein n=1 Tax=Terebratalia transversa TaxID=34513 RepID=A0AAU7EAZ1_TERTR